MGKRKIKVNMTNLMQNVLEKKTIKFYDLIEIHKAFVEDKALEGVSERTIKDYYSSLNYFKKFLDYEYRSEIDHLAINSRVLKNYTSFSPILDIIIHIVRILNLINLKNSLFPVMKIHYIDFLFHQYDKSNPHHHFDKSDSLSITVF